MIRLRPQSMDTLAEVQEALQKAIQLELSTLPPYLYALFTIQDGTNEAARRRITAIVAEEMIHMALACNVLNAIGGRPVVGRADVVPTYPGPLPFGIGGDGKGPFVVHLLPFSPEAMLQAIDIEEPEKKLDIPDRRELRAAEPTFQTIGEFYDALHGALGRLPASGWATTPRNQLTAHPYLAGELFPVTCVRTASEAIRRIVSEGEGTTDSPLDFEGEVAHYYRFKEMHRDRVLEKASSGKGYRWGEPLGIDWTAVLPAIADPATHDFSGDPVAAAAQDGCDRAFTTMLIEIDRAVNGETARLGNAVRAMFELRRAARTALATPLAGRDQSAGPAFRFRADLA